MLQHAPPPPSPPSINMDKSQYQTSSYLVLAALAALWAQRAPLGPETPSVHPTRAAPMDPGVLSGPCDPLAPLVHPAQAPLGDLGDLGAQQDQSTLLG